MESYRRLIGPDGMFQIAISDGIHPADGAQFPVRPDAQIHIVKIERGKGLIEIIDFFHRIGAKGQGTAIDGVANLKDIPLRRRRAGIIDASTGAGVQ